MGAAAAAEDPWFVWAWERLLTPSSLCWCTLFNFLLTIGSTLLMIYVQPSTAGQPVFVATRVLGYSGLAASLCLMILLLQMWNAVPTGRRDDKRVIDSLFDSLV